MEVVRRDYSHVLQELQQKAFTYSEGRWNTYEDGDIGDTILKILASHNHTVDYYFMRYLDELCYPPNEVTTMQQFNELLNYKRVSHSALRANIRLDVFACGPTSPSRINKLHRIELNADGELYEFVVLEDYVLMPNINVMDMLIGHGELFSITERAVAIKRNRIYLGEQPVDFSSIILTVDGEEWEQVESIFYAPFNQKRYSLHEEEDGFYLYMREGWLSDAPSDGSRVTVKGIKVLPIPRQGRSCFKFSFIDPVVSDNGEDVTELLRLLPRELIIPESSKILGDVVSDRAVTLDDYKNLVSDFPSVVLAQAYDVSNSPIVDPFEVEVVAVSQEGILDPYNKEGIREYLNRIGLSYITLSVGDPELVLLNITVEVGLREDVDSSQESIIRDRINYSLNSLFKLGNIPIGYDLQSEDEELVSVAVNRSDERIVSIDNISIDYYGIINHRSVYILNQVTVMI